MTGSPGGGRRPACRSSCRSTAFDTPTSPIRKRGTTTAAILAAAIDYTTRRLPDALTYPIAGAGLLAFAALQITDPHTSLVRAVLGGLLYGGGMLIIALLQPRSFALGDIKLVAGLGIWAAGLTGWIGLYLTVLLGLIMLVLTGRLAKLRSGSSAFCAGPSLVGGFVIALLLA